MAQATLAPVTRSVTVVVSVEAAFRVFTEEIGRWWPLQDKSVSGDARAAVIEPRVGGRVFETAGDGGEHDWGEVLVWEPPRRFAMTWRVTATPTEVEVRFTSEANGTRVDLEHRGWERFGEGADEKRGQYDSGWIAVLDRYVAATA